MAPLTLSAWEETPPNEQPSCWPVSPVPQGDPALGPQDQKMSVCPDVYEWQGEAGDCLILACDGVFDVMSNQDLAALVSNRVADGAEVGAIASEVRSRVSGGGGCCEVHSKSKSCPVRVDF